MDESSRYKLGEFPDCESAVRACKAIVDEFLEQYSPSTAIEEMHKGFSFFGEDPFILTDDPNCKFSAREYAAERCRQIAGKGDSSGN
jgi:hypothetical protein